AEPQEPERPGPRTVVTADAARSIITHNDSPDVPFDRSVNPYRGCEHGCVYCFARPTHAYLGLSPGLDFESKIFSKPDAAGLLRAALRRPGYRCAVVALGSNTDPYQPLERRLRVTRRILQVLAEHRHPVAIVTKASLVLRDLDLLVPMAGRRLAHVMISVTTLDENLARRMEPRAPAPRRRLETIRSLARAGVAVGVLASPIIPGLNDAEIERILEACASAGAAWAGYTLVRLPHEVGAIFGEWLEGNYPLRASRVLGLVRATQRGRLHDGRFGSRMRGTGPYADLLHRRFEVACGRLGLRREPEPLDAAQFRVPRGPAAQASLFE
ncbi:MAG: PA0069 family radical SAM protein, partial [Planctomycetota bacterium]